MIDLCDTPTSVGFVLQVCKIEAYPKQLSCAWASAFFGSTLSAILVFLCGQSGGAGLQAPSSEVLDQAVGCMMSHGTR